MGSPNRGASTSGRSPEIRKRYLYYCGNRVLWDIAMRSIGRDVPLPHPFAPRKLTLKSVSRANLTMPPGRGTAS